MSYFYGHGGFIQAMEEGMIKLFGYSKVALFITLNILLNAATLEDYLWLEGRVRGGVFRNWAKRFRYAPRKFVQPTTEAEIVDLVKNSGSLRVFGSGHYFNAGVVSDDTLVSLDDYSGVIRKDRHARRIAVKGGDFSEAEQRSRGRGRTRQSVDSSRVERSRSIGRD